MDRIRIVGGERLEGTIRISGAKNAALPLMIGVIAGELFAALGWIVVGLLYYLVTGQTPADYVLLPR